MKVERIDLYAHFHQARPEGAAGYLTTYLPDGTHLAPGTTRPAMLVIAGGGYEICSEREMEPIALHFTANGYHAFTLQYSLAPLSYPTPLLEACMAMLYIRECAAAEGISADHVGVIGFSAGGHLAGMLSNLYAAPEIRAALGNAADRCRPDATVYAYPVVLSGQYAHKGSLRCISGGDEQLAERLSIDKCITPDSPPAFIWSTVTDGCVPAENSLQLALACKAAGVPFEFHLFENGCHGLSLATEETAVASDFLVRPAISVWFDLMLTWLSSHGFVLQTGGANR